MAPALGIKKKKIRTFRKSSDKALTTEESNSGASRPFGLGGSPPDSSNSGASRPFGLGGSPPDSSLASRPVVSTVFLDVPATHVDYAAVVGSVNDQGARLVTNVECAQLVVTASGSVRPRCVEIVRTVESDVDAASLRALARCTTPFTPEQEAVTKPLLRRARRLWADGGDASVPAARRSRRSRLQHHLTRTTRTSAKAAAGGGVGDDVLPEAMLMGLLLRRKVVSVERWLALCSRAPSSMPPPSSTVSDNNFANAPHRAAVEPPPPGPSVSVHVVLEDSLPPIVHDVALVAEPLAVVPRLEHPKPDAWSCPFRPPDSAPDPKRPRRRANAAMTISDISRRDPLTVFRQAKSGYCEHCRCHYLNLLLHVRTDEHKRNSEVRLRQIALDSLLLGPHNVSS